MGDAGAEDVAALSWTTSRFTARFAPSASENVTLWPTRTSGGARANGTCHESSEVVQSKEPPPW